MLSVRDLVRQIPAEWQENVKHRSGMSYARFLARITDPARNSRIASWFWSVQEVPEILDRWGADLPPERIHLVTVPSPGGAPDLLWKRFSQAFGLEGIDLVLEDERVNPSLGRPRDGADPPDQPLGQPRARARRLPPARPRAAGPPDAVAPGAVAAAGPAAGTGALGGRSARRRSSPRSSGAATTSSATSTTCGATRRCTRTSTPTGRANATSPARPSTPSRPCSSRTPGCAARRPGSQAELDETRHALSRSYLRPSYRAREKAVKGLARSRVGRGLLGAYRLARGRSSRSA